MLLPVARRLLLISGTVASIVALLLNLDPKPDEWSGFEVSLGVLAVVGLAGLAFVETRDVLAKTPRSYKGDQEIRDYLYSWIGTGGRVVIFTRDMTWVSDDRMVRLLSAKAEASELTICMPEATSLTNNLAERGAQIVTYSELDFVPRSRFTIVRSGRADAEVAIGRTIDGLHTIEEFRVGEHPAFALAEDLVELARRISDKDQA